MKKDNGSRMLRRGFYHDCRLIDYSSESGVRQSAGGQGAQTKVVIGTKAESVVLVEERVPPVRLPQMRRTRSAGIGL
jgi:hypothetical protein